MNETNYPASASGMPGPTSDQSPRSPDEAMLPGSGKAGPAGVGLLESAVQGAHDTVDRLSDGAAPAVRQLGESVSDAGEKLHAKANQLREKRDEWAEGMRATVRSNPLVSLAAALALGAAFARLTR